MERHIGEGELKMDIQFNFENKEELEKFILVFCIGLTTGLFENIISINESEQMLFSLYSEKLLKKEKVRKKIRDLILLGCELEDVESLIPEHLKESILEIRKEAAEILGRMKELQIKKKWIRHGEGS